MHGPPVHIGDPAAIGIKDLSQPDLPTRGQNAPPRPSEIALFWPCSATLRDVAIKSKLPLMIVDYPVSMFMTDRLSEEAEKALQRLFSVSPSANSKPASNLRWNKA